MDPKYFKSKIEEYATVTQVKVPKTGGLREADGCEEVKYRDQLVVINKDHNPTLNFRIEKLKPHFRNCDDCGDYVADRKVETKLHVFPDKHWRSRCTACSRYKNPETKQFDITLIGVPLQNYFASWVNKKKSISSDK